MTDLLIQCYNEHPEKTFFPARAALRVLSVCNTKRAESRSVEVDVCEQYDITLYMLHCIRSKKQSGRFGEISQEITIAKLAPAQSDVVTLPYNWYRAVSGRDAATLRES